MGYYCESYSESVNHVTPSILILDGELQSQGNQLTPSPTILDLGGGNDMLIFIDYILQCVPGVFFVYSM